MRRFLTLWEFFEQIDTSNDQIIQFDEFQQALPLINQWGIVVEDALKTFAELDESNMEGISFSAFARWALKEGSFQVNLPIFNDLSFGQLIFFLSTHEG